MKYVWEEHDIECGRRVWGWNRAMNSECIIGYDCTDRNVAKWFTLVSLADGSLLGRYSSKADVAEAMNTHGYRPADVNQTKWPDVAQKD